RHVVYEGLRTRGIRPIFLFQAAHAKAERAFGDELQQLAAAAGGAVRIIRVLSDVDGAEQGTDYDAAGRIDMALLSRVLPFNDYDFYLCGPPQFTQSLYEALRDYNIADRRIHAEAFGPSSLARTPDVAAPVSPRRPAATAPVPVAFTASLKEARWTPESGTLLELAEARGLSPAFSCREGNCGTCRTKLLAGAVTYQKQPTAAVADDEVLICCAVPAKPEAEGEERIQLDL
ncbi:MAG: 2Fe-2S iron-sulfur cluster-binding protein, partial [Bradyrhizobium sp.]